MGWDASDVTGESVESPEIAEPGEPDEPVLGACGIDIERFEKLVEQNNCGSTEYPEE